MNMIDFHDGGGATSVRSRLLTIGLLLALGITATGASGTAEAVRDPRIVDLSADIRQPAKRHPHVDWRLTRLVELRERASGDAIQAFARANAIAFGPDGGVRVTIHAAAAPSIGSRADRIVDDAVFGAIGQAIERNVRRHEGEVTGRSGNLLEARVPLRAVHDLARGDEIVWIEPLLRPYPTVGRLTSQGVRVTNASTVQDSMASYRPSGEPVRVGILDLGFTGFRDLLGRDLPSDVTTRSFHQNGLGGGTAHGTAVAEIVHDMAPGAELFFANFDSLASNGEAVDWLIEQGVDLINYSVAWFNAGPGDGEGPVNQDVMEALGAGVEWVVSAGNSGRAHWEGDFRDPDGDGFLNYAGADETNSVRLRSGETLIVFLNWNDWFRSDQDYDLFLFFSVGDGPVLDDPVLVSNNAQTGSQPPVEAVGVQSQDDDLRVHVAIRRTNASRSVRLETFFLEVPRELQYIVPEGSLTIPADTRGAIAVGATFWQDDDLEPFSSRGPTTDGRIKPDFAAPDGVRNVTFDPFFGTSASAPHVAGAVALMKARFSVFTLEEIVDILEARAIDRGPTGKDNRYGYGRLDLVGRP